ncbi:hypothetical protein N8963_02075 [Candidatus Pelagibacter sp.]|nr:hypothetical protein [Candidatus Pelagibacter sp.]
MSKYTKFILTVIAVALIGNIYQVEIITSAEAAKSNCRKSYQLSTLKIVKENNAILRNLYNR